MAFKSAFLDHATVSAGAGDPDLSQLRAVLPDIELHEVTADAQVDARIAGCQVLLVNKVKLTRARIEANPQLRLICLTATGTDNVDLVAAREHGVAVCNVRDYCTRSLVQHVLAVILSLTHGLRGYTDLATGGAWARSPQFTLLDHPIRELSGCVLGIVGYGNLGRAVAQAAQAALDMKILIANRPGAAATPGRVDLDALLRQADVVSLHCPLNAATRNLIGERELALMKPDALLVNTARGGLVDAVALAAALRARRLGGAAIDVLAQEPPVDGSPLLDATVPNLIITPHVAWAAREARQRCLDETAANVADFLRGGARNRVV
jgi:glycerate dehydrogenase